MMWGTSFSLPQARVCARRGEGGSTALAVETGGAAQSSDDHIHHRLQLPIHLMIPEPQHAKSFAAQKRIPHIIPARRVIEIMLTAIDLDHEVITKRHEVHDDMPDRRLPPEVKAERLEVAQLDPQLCFLRRQVFAQLPCECVGHDDLACGDTPPVSKLAERSLLTTLPIRFAPGREKPRASQLTTHTPPRRSLSLPQAAQRRSGEGGRPKAGRVGSRELRKSKQ